MSTNTTTTSKGPKKGGEKASGGASSSGRSGGDQNKNKKKKKNNNKKKNTAALPSDTPAATTAPEMPPHVNEAHLATPASLAQIEKKLSHLVLDDTRDQAALQQQKKSLEEMSTLVVQFVKMSAEASVRSIPSIEWQILAVAFQEQWVKAMNDTNAAIQTTHQFKVNTMDWRVKCIDTILARRPRGHQLLPRDADLKVAIDNPDLGEASFITDDALFGEAMTFSTM